MFDFRTLAAVVAIFTAHPILADEALTAFDVAEDLSRFSFASAPAHEDGMPAYGNAFVTQGYIYPAGTLDNDVEGTHPDGSPVWPDLVLGTWTCDGYFVGDGAYTSSGSIVISRQVFQFNDGSVIVTHGPELVDANVANNRPITGATGTYRGVADVMEQTLLGMSEGFGVRLQFEIDTTSVQPGSSHESAVNQG